MDTFNPSQMPPVQMQNQPEKKSSLAPLIAVIIILALIVIGGLYFLKQRASNQAVTIPPVETPITTEQPSDIITESLNQQSTSDDLNSIETDLNATNINNLDQGAALIKSTLR
jgi:biopolymer transport protein ExbD